MNYLDPQLRESRKAFFGKKPEFQELVTSLIKQEKIDIEQLSICYPFRTLWREAAQLRLDNLHNNREFMENTFNKFCESICTVAGFTSFRITERANFKHIITFSKS